MKITIITGSYPPEVCGVGDYTRSLVQSLRQAGASVEVFHGTNWSPSSSRETTRRLLDIPADIRHIQYPTRGYGWQLGPQLLALATPMIATLHEASQAHLLRQLSLLPFTLRSPRVIFTTEYERAYATRLAPWIAGRSSCIPIGSNVAVMEGVAKPPSRTATYFGLFRQQKGLEQVLEVASIFKRRGRGLRVRIVGAPVPGCEEYYANLRSSAEGLPIDWQVALPEEELALELAKTRVAYLPFPDGASERRSSLIAMMMNFVAVVTTRGAHTPPSMDGAVAWASSAAEAAEILERLLNQSQEQATLQQRAKAYASRFAWQHIAEQHLQVYSEVMSNGPLKTANS